MISLKIEVRAEPQPDSRDARVIQIGEPFHEIQADNGEYIVDAHTCFHIRQTPQLISSKHPIHQWELHLVWVRCRVVLIP